MKIVGRSVLPAYEIIGFLAVREGAARTGGTVADAAEEAVGSIMPGSGEQPVRGCSAQACEPHAVLHPRVPFADVHYVSCSDFSA